MMHCYGLMTYLGCVPTSHSELTVYALDPHDPDQDKVALKMNE